MTSQSDLPPRINRGWMFTQLLALDRAGAALLFNRPDVTISSLCGLFRDLSKTLPDFNVLQLLFLHVVGAALEKIQPGHCANAIQTDIATAESTLALLSGPAGK